MLRDSRARILVVSSALFDKVKPALKNQPGLTSVVIAGGEVRGCKSLARLLATASDRLDPAPTTCDDPAFWLYSSGSTGTPKGAVHVPSTLVTTAEPYAPPTPALAATDLAYSAAEPFVAFRRRHALSLPLPPRA